MISPSFYVAGGTLRGDAPSYIRRKADDDLYEGLLRGDFCYILTARQMGKSSLMVRAGARLQQAQIAVAVLDLTGIGQNVNPEQWYGGLVMQMGHRLGLVEEAMLFWQTDSILGPLQRWIRTIREAILPRCSAQRIVIFIDEIDAVRSLPFSADEFFAGIRECYNQRSRHAEMERLSFCLLGVAAPTDLIRDTRMTPFNIGRRIELHDFTLSEAAPLAGGLGNGRGSAEAVLQRVMHWTGGHPYLTQRMCLEISQRAGVRRSADVDDMCAELFFSHRAQERDDNLLFVRERLLRSEVDRGGLLDLYRHISKGRTVRDDDSNPFASTLRLSGIVRAIGGNFEVRNRIYARVFNPDWIEGMMPQAELRRQRAAFRRGIVRAALVAVLVVALGITFALIAFRRGQARADQRLLYDANMRLAQEAWDHSYIDRVEELLQATSPKPAQEDLRGFEWYLFRQLVRRDLWRSMEPHPVIAASLSDDKNLLCVAEYQREPNQPYKILVKAHDLRAQRELHSVRIPTDAAFPRVLFSPDCRRAIISGPDRTIEQWDLRTGNRTGVLEGHRDRLSDLSLSRDGSTLASADLSGMVKLWDMHQMRALWTLTHAESWPRSVALSKDGKMLAIADESLQVSLFDTHSRHEVAQLTSQEGAVTGVAFFPDGNQLLTADKNGTLEAWDLRGKRPVSKFTGHSEKIESVSFSPDGKLLATGSWDRTVKIWSILTGRELETVRGHGDKVSSVSFSPDGRYLITGAFDHAIKIWDVANNSLPRLPQGVKRYFATSFSSTNTLLALGINEKNQVKLWNLSTRSEVATLDERADSVLCGSFSADQRLLATAGLSKSVKIWDSVTGRPIRVLSDNSGDIYAVTFSPDGKLLVSGGYDRVLRLWNVATGEKEAQLRSNLDNSHVAVFSPAGKQLASGTREGTVQLWEVATRRLLRAFRGHTGAVRTIAFSADGQWLATGADDHTLKLWDVASGRLIHTLGLADVVQRATFSPDGRRLITGGADGAIRLWDIFSGQELMTLPGHTDEVKSITFSGDGKTLVTSGSDGVIRLWPLTQATPQADWLDR
jgi:WD40 repeat protein